MNRLQKKCFVISAGFHLLLLLILFIGPAFLPADDQFINMPVLDFVPAITTDELISGGGNRNARPPAALPDPPAPQPPAATPQSAQPTVRENRPAPRTTPNSVSDKKVHKPNISLKKVTRDTTKSPDSARTPSNSAVKRQTEQVNTALRNLRGNLSSGTSIELPGPGGGGLPYANFLQAVQSVYARAWQGRVPDGATDKDTDAIASVTIARDGTVISSKITRSSGNASVDQAVQGVLERVTYAAPLPESATENQRTVTIKFKVNTGQLAG